MSSTIIYPINVQALCIPKEAAIDSNFIRQEQNFFRLYDHATNSGSAPLAKEVINEPFGDLQPMPTGIHLHWALPDAISHIVQDDTNKKDYIPPAPNRWLVTRIVSKNHQLQREHIKSWVVESDRIVDPQRVANRQSALDTNIPYLNPPKGTPPYRFLGQATPLEEWATAQEDTTSKDYFELNTLGFGQLHFSALYQNCATVFGFHDADEFAFLEPAHKLSYSVIGWHSKKDDDLLQHSRKQEAYNNIVAPILNSIRNNADNSELKDIAGLSQSTASTLYQGVVYNISWDPTAWRKLYDNSGKLADLQISIGNTTKEAFAALPSEGNPTAEILLNAKLHDVPTESGHHSLETLTEEELFQASFEYSPGGTQYLDKRPVDDEAEKRLRTNLLSDINKSTTELEESERVKLDLRQCLFEKWGKWLELRYGSHEELYKELAEQNREHQLSPDEQAAIPEGQLALEKFSNFLKACFPMDEAICEKLQNELEYTFDILLDSSQATEELAKRNNSETNQKTAYQASPKAYFAAPKDPAILLFHEQLPSWKFAGDRNKTVADLPIVRTDDQIQNFAKEISPACPSQVPEQRWNIVVALLAEATAFSTVSVPSFTNPPQPLSITKWERNPWIPLLLDWEIEFIPLAHGPEKNFDQAFIASHFRMDEKTNNLFYKEDTCLSGTYKITGRTSLNDLAAFNIKETLLPDGDHAGQNEQIKPGFMGLTQRLEGLHSGLLMKRSMPEFEVADIKNTNEGLTQNVYKFIDKTALQSANTGLAFCPIRNGLFRISRLRFVDAFGQIKKVEKNALSNTIYANALKRNGHEFSTIDKNIVLGGFKGLMPPRITQAARFNFAFTQTKTGDNQTPIYGWILPNHLQNSLFFFDAQSQPIAVLAKGSTNKIERYPPSLKLPEDYKISDTLQLVMSCFENRSGTELDQFITYHTSALRNKSFSGAHSNHQLRHLIGRPIAITAAAFSVELMHRPATDLSWRATIINTFVERELLDKSTMYSGINQNFSQLAIPVAFGNSTDPKDGTIAFIDTTNETSTKQIHLIPINNVNERKTLVSTPLSYPGIPEVIEGCNGTKEVILLMDPELYVQGATGLLPKVKLKLSQEEVTNALEKLKYTFAIHPVLTRPDSIDFPAPEFEDYEWAWMEKQADGERAESDQKIVPPQEILSDQVWLREGSMVLSEKQKNKPE